MKRKRSRQTRPRSLDRDDLARVAGGDENRTSVGGGGYFQIREEGG